MNKYEKLLEKASEENIQVDENFPFNGKTSGLYIDGNIALSTKLKTEVSKACILSEELGHHYTSVGNILNPNLVQNRKQEYKARIWAYKEMISPADLLMASKTGCRNRFEISEYLEVTEEFLEEALNYFSTVYPDGYKDIAHNCTIKFRPNLQVIKNFD